MKSKNEPIVLSGRVYLDGILAQDNAHFALPAVLMVGDIKLHNVNREGKRQRFGQTISYTGFIVANVYDGKRFRKLLLRKLAAVESTHTGPVARREAASAVARHLRTLVRREAVWFANDSGYEVTRVVVQDLAPKPATAPAAAVEKKAPVDADLPKTVAPVAVEKTVPVAVGGAEVSVTVNVSVNVGPACPNKVRRSRRGKQNDNQLELFVGEK